MRAPILLAILGLGTACASDPPAELPSDAAVPDLGTADADAPGDSGVVEDGGVDSGLPPDAGLPPNECDAWGLPRVGFDSSASGLLFGERAGDFTVTTTTGAEWNLQQEWTGCESYVFLVYFPGSAGNALFRSGLDDLVTSRPNVHYFFLSSEADLQARLTRLGALSTRLVTAINRRARTPEAQAEQWRRFHLVQDRANQVPGSVGAMVSDYLAFAPTSVIDLGDGRRAPAPAPAVFGIDRHQRWDAGGNLNTYVGGPTTFGMASYLAPFYDYQQALDARLAAETDALRIPLLEEDTSTRVFTRTATLPAAAVMASFNRLEVDVSITCPARNPFECSEWDRIARISVCQDSACQERRELARWITPYWRRGQQHWTIDASPLLPLLAEGGLQSFYVETGPDWERATPYRADIALRFRSGGAEAIPTGALLAFRGGVFDASYNTRDPFVFTAPADASRVSLVVLISGHGQETASNCAEWCDHRHQFSLNGTDLPEIAPANGIGSGLGCAARAAEGAVPGQWGNWAPQRAYWCPGLPVQAIELDLSAIVRPGQANQLGYAASFAGAPPPGGDIDLSAYVVWYP